MSTTRKLASRWLAKKAAESAAEAYDRQSKVITKKLADLDKWLKKHAVDFKKEGSKNWGYPGDLGHLVEVLTSFTEGQD